MKSSGYNDSKPAGYAAEPKRVFLEGIQAIRDLISSCYNYAHVFSVYSSRLSHGKLRGKDITTIEDRQQLSPSWWADTQDTIRHCAA